MVPRGAWISSWQPPLWSLGATEGTISIATVASLLVEPVRTAESAVVAEKSCPSAGFACVLVKGDAWGAEIELAVAPLVPGRNRGHHQHRNHSVGARGAGENSWIGCGC